LPQNRGIFATIYVKGDAEAVWSALDAQFAAERFVHVLPMGQMPAPRHVRGSNNCLIGVKADRIAGRTIIISTLDNLMKGASGQAVQNANLMLGLDEAAGLEFAPIFP
jgi:N-acetyl-gamma-glutamyl-phosphate reductase